MLERALAPFPVGEVIINKTDLVPGLQSAATQSKARHTLW